MGIKNLCTISNLLCSIYYTKNDFFTNHNSLKSQIIHNNPRKKTSCIRKGKTIKRFWLRQVTCFSVLFLGETKDPIIQKLNWEQQSLQRRRNRGEASWLWPAHHRAGERRGGIKGGAGDVPCLWPSPSAMPTIHCCQPCRMAAAPALCFLEQAIPPAEHTNCTRELFMQIYIKSHLNLSC